MTLLCKLLKISRSGYYKYKKRVKPKYEERNELLCSLITEYHATFDGILGYRRMTIYINKLNQTSYSEGYIHRLMKHLNISSRIRKKKVNRKAMKAEHTKANILSRNFTASKPNEKWLTDVTEFSIPGERKKLFLSPILDLYDNSIIAYNISNKNDCNLVFTMFDEAIKKHPDSRPILHSDRGFQYTSKEFKNKIEKIDIEHSMSRPGKCIDNGPMESFFGTLKTEMFYDKKFKNLKELEEKIREYIKFYNERRFQAKLGCMAPLEYRNHAA